MSKISIVVLAAVLAVAAVAQDLTPVKVTRRLTEREEVAALIYAKHTNDWLRYRIALYDKHLQTNLGASMRKHFEEMKEQAEKESAKHIDWGKSWATNSFESGTNLTELVTDKDVDFSDVLTTNKTPVVIER